ncbi:hypothetical protein TTHERM_00322930 (macronuclear) [Tetrahymena thermophila SB210]|uniref:Uncharacterized protein n=1 Tax=Tetrahymena thermophila (strain SB210) TaxID=312017 RepID=Q237J2_TETTS|nr:hypothetical protein TTHERM_00322930 [Tetrahymena thermophila SB210]EAR92749.3 hypothetical protein TTHERM_00322930 [Tetrahymena thermophila SB210]|eukprot:XP_001012994.3 hypothetical protein TTHERM_00322930 [Tetrahymena thermophila SB210]
MDLRYNSHQVTNNGSLQLAGQLGKMQTTTPPKISQALNPSNINVINNSLNSNSVASKFPLSYRKNFEDSHMQMPNNGRANSISDRENYFDSNINGYKNYASNNQVNQVSPNLLVKKFEREQEDYVRLSLEEINRELDINMNEIIVLLNKRKHLIMVKRQKLKDEFIEQIELMKRQSAEDLQKDLNRSSIDDNIIQNLANNTDSFSKMKKVVQSVTKDISSNTHEKQKLEMSRSADFWNTNKNYEDEVDILLSKLKQLDSDLEKCNYQIQEVCRNLDNMEEQIKILLLTKDEDHVRRAEPVFNQKQRLHEQLNQMNSQRNKIKDEKIHLISRIINFLTDLKHLRGERLQDLAEVFGIDDNTDSSIKIQYYIDFVEQLENLAKVKDNLLQQESLEEPIQMNIDRLFKENDQLFSELIKKQSEEAKAYADLSDNLVKRLNMQRAIELFMNQANLNGINHLDIRDLLKKFKENILFLKPLVEEDVALRQGLNKTYETINTFSNILLAIETEKERRKELVAKLEQCIRLKQDGDLKTEDLRNVEMEITKRIQQKKNLEEDLDHILSDADLEEYKKLGLQIRQLEKDADDLNKKRMRVQTDVDQIQQQVVVRINQIRTDYDDIMKEVISNDVMNNYDFKNANDIKQVKNLLKKTFKRLGMTFEEPRNL